MNDTIFKNLVGGTMIAIMLFMYLAGLNMLWLFSWIISVFVCVGVALFVLLLIIYFISTLVQRHKSK